MCVSINGPFDHTCKCACVMTAQHIKESVESISRDGLDTSVYVIQNKKPKNSAQIELLSNFHTLDICQIYLPETRKNKKKHLIIPETNF